MAIAFFQIVARSMPNLKSNLKSAGMNYKPDEFIRQTFMSAFFMTTGVIVSLTLILAKLEFLNGLVMVISIPLLFFIIFSYLLKYPQAKIARKQKDISREIIFAGRHLIVELESGVPLYNALVNTSKSYETIGKYFREITDRVDLGTSMDEALNDAIEYIPSDNFRRLLWQILNSIRTGTNISKSLMSVLEQISREQMIEINEYGKKLNPFAMFYMIIAVIIPSLGTTMLVVLSSFVDIKLKLSLFMVIALLLGFIQFMFLAIINFSRPAVDL
jgi:archaeal flagellar protein FlaJ